MKSLKLLCIILLLCVIVSLFAACDFSSSETEPPTETESETETDKSTKKPSSSSNKKPTVVYDEEIPQRPAELPKYNGEDFKFSKVYLGEESQMRVAIETNADEYRAYLSELENSGYTSYADNKIGNNLSI